MKFDPVTFTLHDGRDAPSVLPSRRTLPRWQTISTGYLANHPT